ncbi:recombinase family protein [Cohnella panacarvi]|uniref:recombinase family protein n=1 Tax=Cohnella panacarvi TaxID=400776 RepID=UPI00047D0064|nr:recombinase family protein [Cohnella panacarvi]
MKKIRAALYSRVSTDEQRREGYSLTAQVEILEQYCQRNNIEVYDLYEDGGYSGKDFNRPGIQRLLRDLREDKFDVVLAIAVDRISRNNLDVLTFIDRELHPKGKKLLISTCDIDSSTETGKMFISLLGTFAEYERRLIVGRVKNGMEKRAEEGDWNGGQMLGYNTLNKKLVVDEEEAALVKEIFELRSQGKGYKTIANQLNKRGKKTKMKAPFSTNSIKTILENEKYVGNMTWGKQRDWSEKRRKGTAIPTMVDGKHEAIIDRELWQKVQAVKKAKEESNVSQSNFKGEFILSGLLRCPMCGAGTVMSKKKKRDGLGYHLYYMCQNFHSKGSTVCKSNLMKKEMIEDQIIKAIQLILGSEYVVDEVLGKLNKDQDGSITDLSHDLNIQMMKMKELLDRRKILDTDYYKGEIKVQTYDRLSGNLDEEIFELETVIKGIEREIGKSQTAININKEIIIEALKNFDDLFEVASNEEKRKLMRSIIKEIHVEPDRKKVKDIVFWFTEGDAPLQSALPVSEVGRTVS